MAKQFISEKRIVVLSQLCGYTLSEIHDIIDYDDKPFFPTTNQSRKELLIHQGYTNSEIQEILDLDFAY